MMRQNRQRENRLPAQALLPQTSTEPQGHVGDRLWSLVHAFQDESLPQALYAFILTMENLIRTGDNQQASVVFGELMAAQGVLADVVDVARLQNVSYSSSQPVTPLGEFSMQTRTVDTTAPATWHVTRSESCCAKIETALAECCCITSAGDGSMTICLPPLFCSTSDSWGNFCCATPVGCYSSSFYGSYFGGNYTSSSCCLTEDFNINCTTHHSGWWGGHGYADSSATSCDLSACFEPIVNCWSYVSCQLPCDIGHAVASVTSDAASAVASCIGEGCSGCANCLSQSCGCSGSSSGSSGGSSDDGEGLKCCGIATGGGGTIAAEAASGSSSAAASTAAPAVVTTAAPTAVTTTAAPSALSGTARLLASKPPASGATAAYSHSKLYNLYARLLHLMNCDPTFTWVRPTHVAAPVATAMPIFTLAMLACACPRILDNLKAVKNSLPLCGEKKSMLIEKHRGRELCAFMMTWLPCLLSGLPVFPRGGLLTGLTLVSTMSCAMDAICQSARSKDTDYMAFQWADKVCQILGALIKKSPDLNISIDPLRLVLADAIKHIAIAEVGLENAKTNPMTKVDSCRAGTAVLCSGQLAEVSPGMAEKRVKQLSAALITVAGAGKQIDSAQLDDLQSQICRFNDWVQSTANDHYRQAWFRVRSALGQQSDPSADLRPAPTLASVPSSVFASPSADHVVTRQPFAVDPSAPPVALAKAAGL